MTRVRTIILRADAAFLLVASIGGLATDIAFVVLQAYAAFGATAHQRQARP